MKLDSKKIQWVMGAVLVVLLGVVVANALEVPKAIKVSGAVGDICDGRNLGEARATLELVNDRQYVLDKLKAALAEDGTVSCKTNLLQTLGAGAFNQPRVIRRSLGSESVSTRRAACAMLYGDPELKERCAEIALDWLKDEGADGRHRAAMICRQLKLEAARPTLLKIVNQKPETQSDLLLLQYALGALRGVPVEGLAERLLGMVKDEKLGDRVRGTVLQMLEGREDVPRDALARTAIALLNDTGASTVLRSQAALALGSTPTAEAWDALEACLLSNEVTNLARSQPGAGYGAFQRNCLSSLARSAPLDRVKKLLLDRRVYTHPYFGIRIDVCSALAALNVREGIVLDIMGEYLVDEDPSDRQHLVRSEAFLTLWVLAGFSHGIEERELFRIQPRAIRDPERARLYLLKRSRLRAPKVTRAQAEAAEKLAQDLGKMQAVRQTLGDFKEQILQTWRKEAERAAKNKGAAPPKKIAPQGPQPPPEKTAPQGPPPPPEKKDDR